MNLPFDLKLFETSLKTKVLGRPCVFLEQCDSTQERMKAVALSDRVWGSMIIAENQEAGRGRWGRQWIGHEGKSLLFTLALESPAKGPRPAYLAVCLGLGLARACEALLPGQIKLKWPNDLLAGGRKTAGMILDKVEGGLLAGVGLNVFQGEADFDPAIKDLAGSLAMAGARPRRREVLLATILFEMEKALESLKREGFEPLRRAWHGMAAYLGDQVQVRVAAENGEPMEGAFVGLDSDGSLLLRLENGVVEPVTAGDLLQMRPVLT